MINYSSQTAFELKQPELISEWIVQVASAHDKSVGDLDYVFCSDEFLLEINKEYLDHDTYTDIITFDYTMGDLIGGEIYVSIDRVKENADELEIQFEDELHRVMIHGVLHLCGHGDASEEQKEMMRKLEDEALSNKRLMK